MINVKFDLYFKKKLGALFKSNEVDLDGVEANVNLDLNQVANMKINYLVNGDVLTDDVIIKDIDKKLILIPFKSEVRIAGTIIEFEIQANMLNGDVKVSQTYVYEVMSGIGEGVQVGTGGSTDGHYHNNLSTLHKITEAKIKAWDAKSDFSGSYNDLTNKPTIPTVDVTKAYVDGEVSKKADRSHSHSEYATPSYVQEKIAEASLSGGEVDLSAYATKAELNTKADKSHTHNELHSHVNKTVLDGITSSKVNEWNNKSTFSGSYNDLTNKPNIPVVDVTKSYVDSELSKKADKSHSHNELHSHSNKTVLDGITSSKVNEWNNKADKTHTHSQYLTALPTHNHSYNDLSDKPVIPSIEGLATENYVQQKIAEASLSGGEVDLSEYATIDYVDSELSKKANTSHTHNELHSHVNKTVLDGITSSKVNEWNNKSTFSGSYNDLTNKPTIPTVDVTKSYVDNALAKKANTSHTHEEYATKTELNDKADAIHAHSNYATKDELVSKADAGHTHSNYATKSEVANKAETYHTHSEYATYSYVQEEISKVTMGDGISIVALTKEEYEALTVKDMNTLYVIKG